MGYTNSNLVIYKKISPNKTSPRNHVIDTISIHCYVGQVTAKSGCNASHFVKYDPINGASCNYVVGYDGSIGLCVEEKDRSWCTSNRANDNRAVTIEVACEPKSPYKVTDKAMSALIELVADICKRNNIKELKWKGDKSLIGQVDKQNMTVHRWFANKSCPGDYLYGKHGYIAEQVNKKLGVKSSSSSTKSTTTSSNISSSTTKKKTKPTVAKPTIKNGSKGTQVKYLQKDLNYLGFKGADGKKLTVDGIAGTNVVYALKQFQKKYSLEADGVYGENSYEKMKVVMK